jgi:hypothetical protein
VPPSCPRVPDQVGEARGRAVLKGRTDHSGIRISVFNGFVTVANTTRPDGSYCVPVVRSTEGTYVAVFATNADFLPDVRIVQVTGIPAGHSEPARIIVPDIVLLPIAHPERAGALIGSCFDTI